jgi:hypothetical protein
MSNKATHVLRARPLQTLTLSNSGTMPLYGVVVTQLGDTSQLWSPGRLQSDATDTISQSAATSVAWLSVTRIPYWPELNLVSELSRAGPHQKRDVGPITASAAGCARLDIAEQANYIRNNNLHSWLDESKMVGKIENPHFPYS